MTNFTKIKDGAKGFVKAAAVKKALMVSALVGLVMSVFCTSAYAAITSGNADLDVLAGNIFDSLEPIKIAGLGLVAAIITFAVIFYGGKWLFGLFRRWMSSAS